MSASGSEAPIDESALRAIALTLQVVKMSTALSGLDIDNRNFL